MSLLTRLLTISAICLLPQSALANLYFQINAGQTQHDTGVNSLNGSKLDETSEGYQFAIGVRVFKEVNASIDIEVSHLDLGDAELSGSTGDTFRFNNTDYVFTSNGVITQNAISTALVGKSNFNLTKNLQGFGKLGFHFWETETTLATHTSSTNITDDGIDMIYGLGLDYAVTKRTRVSLGYDVLKFDEEQYDYAYVGAKYLFGDVRN